MISMTIDMSYYRKINGLNGVTDKKDFLQKQAIKSINKNSVNVLSTFEILVNSDVAEDVIADGINRKCIFDYFVFLYATKPDNPLINHKQKEHEQKNLSVTHAGDRLVADFLRRQIRTIQ